MIISGGVDDIFFKTAMVVEDEELKLTLFFSIYPILFMKRFYQIHLKIKIHRKTSINAKPIDFSFTTISIFILFFTFYERSLVP
jgi:hypothetical protein